MTSKFVTSCANSHSILLQNLNKFGFLSVLPNNKSLYHTGSSQTLRSNAVNPQVASSGIVTSPYPSTKIPRETLVEYLWKNTEAWDDNTVATCATSGRSYTYGTMKFLIDRFAQSLLGHLGLKQGDVVAILMPNIPEYVIVSHGIMTAGLTATFVNPLYTPDELTRQFQNAGVKSIVTISLFLEGALKVASQLPGYKGTICVGGEDDKSKNVHSIESLIAAGHAAELPKVDPSTLGLLPYSSGTTGLPKGVMLSHENLVANLAQADHPELLCLEPQEYNQKCLTVLPFFHIYGFNAIMNCCIKLGISMVTLPKFTPEDYIKALMEHRPYFLFVVPSLLLFLASHPAVTKEHLASVNAITSGAAPATEGLIQKFKEKIGRDILIRQGYGMTEAAPVITLTPRNLPPSKKDTAGVLYPNTEAKVVSLINEDVLGPHQTGELYVRGPQVMLGYLNNEKATAETITEDGWLRTGDVVYYDDDGYFYIVDRCKELIKVKGNQVSPTELENIILEIPGVADAAVVGIPDTLSGEIPRAYVVCTKDAKINEEDVISYVNPKLISYKRLTGGVKFIESIPRNPSGKILRNQLKVIN